MVFFLSCIHANMQLNDGKVRTCEVKMNQLELQVMSLDICNDTELYLYKNECLFWTKSSSCFMSTHSMFSRQQFRGAALFRHKHAKSSEEEFTSGKSSSEFTIAEESTDEPVQFPSSSRSIGLRRDSHILLSEWHICSPLPKNKFKLLECTCLK